MKRIILVTSLLLMFVLSGCNNNTGNDNSIECAENECIDTTNTYTFTGNIESIEGNNAIINVIDNEENHNILSSGNKVSLNIENDTHTFKINDEVTVYYTGEIMESDPLQVNLIKIEKIEHEESKPNFKIAINIEGIITEIKGNTITLNNGKKVIIDDSTLFQTQNVAENIEVNKELKIGNYIQGFTNDDLNNDTLSVTVISYNGNTIENEIKTEVIIKANNFDGTLNDDLIDLGITNIENIFDLNDTQMYLLTLDREDDTIIKKLEKLEYVEYAEYNTLISIN